MNELNIFDYDGMKIETIMHDNGKGKVVPYFKAETVATILGYTTNKRAYELCKYPVKVSKLDMKKLESAKTALSNENNDLLAPYHILS